MSGQAGVHVEPHQPALGAVDPGAVSEAAIAQTAAVQAAATLRDHYAQQVLGQGSQAGDLMPAESTQQSYPASAPEPSTPGKSTL